MTYALMALVALLAAALLTRPWWSAGGAAPLRRRAANARVFRTRLAELEDDVASGVLDRAAADALRAELEARLVAEAGTEEPAPARALSRRAAVLIAALPLAIAATGYWLRGSWRDQQLVDIARRDPEQAQALAIQAMVARLEQRLQQAPDDAEGWAMLGRSRSVLRDHAAAAQAYARANELSGGQNADWLVGEGEALGLAHDHDLRGKPRTLFEAALKLEPTHGRALWYAGLAAAQVEDYAATRAHWLALRALPDLPEDLQQALDERLQEIARITGEPLPAPTAPVAAAPEVALHLTVDLEPGIAPKPGAVLFVFAKAADGPPMPLAVRRIEAPQFPLEVTLDDSLAMLPQLKLSGFERWVVTARLSSSGDVQGAPGDPEGSRAVDRAQAGSALKLEIDHSRP